MTAYIAQRFFQGLIVLFLVLFVVFLLLRLSGDPALLLLPDTATPEEIAAFRERSGFNDSLRVQFQRFLADALRGDFGDSHHFGASATSVVMARLPNTIKLAFTAQGLAILLGIPMGILSALRRNSVWDRSMVAFATLGQSIPNFWLGLMLVWLFAIQFGLFPVSGQMGARSLVLPAIALGVEPLARITRITRTAILESVGQEYATTAVAKGLRRKAVILRHILRTAMIPVVTLIGLDIARLINGSVVIETVFAWPGIGRLVTDAIYARDYAIVQAVVAFVAVAYVIINFLVDVLYTKLDPRVRL